MSYLSPDTVFAFLVNSYGTVAIFVYVLIAVAELRLRARLERERPGAPADPHVGLPLAHVHRDRRHARDRGRHGRSSPSSACRSPSA